VFELLQVVGKSGGGDGKLGLDVADHHAAGMGGEQEADDLQARL